MVLTRSMNKEIDNIILIFKSSYPQNCKTTTMNMYLNKFKNFVQYQLQYQPRVKISVGAYNILMQNIKWYSDNMTCGDDLHCQFGFEQMGGMVFVESVYSMGLTPRWILDVLREEREYEAEARKNGTWIEDIY